jgi:hypothetical protein
LEKRRAVGALCHLQRAREEKLLLVGDMATCSKNLLARQSRLTNSVALSVDKGIRALLQKKRVELHTLMQKLWNIFLNFLPDLPLVCDLVPVVFVPDVGDDYELDEMNQWEIGEEGGVSESEEDLDSEDSDSYYNE